MIGASCSTVSVVIARCSRPRPRYRASAPRAPRRFPDLDDFLSLLELGLRALGATAQLRDLAVATVGRPAPPRTAQFLQRAILALLAPIRQVRRYRPSRRNS